MAKTPDQGALGTAAGGWGGYASGEGAHVWVGAPRSRTSVRHAASQPWVPALAPLPALPVPFVSPPSLASPLLPRAPPLFLSLF